MRIDKWLWAARFFKTRSLAVDDLQRGRIQVNGVQAKPARDLRIGDTVELRGHGHVRTVAVCGLSERRGPAAEAQRLYQETADSLRRRAEFEQSRRLGVEPALSLSQGRPDKHARRAVERAWGDRWSASIEDGD